MTALDSPGAQLHSPNAGGWPDLLEIEPPDIRVFVAIALAAAGTDLAMRSGVVCLAGALLALVVPTGLLASGRVSNRRAWPVLAAVPVVGVFVAVRMSPWLVPFDVLAAASLLVAGASLSRDGDPTDLTIPNLIGRAAHAVIHGVLAPGLLFARKPRDGDSAGSRARPGAAVARGAILAGPLLLVLGVLLGSADPIFASFFRLPTGPTDLMLHAVLLGFGAWGVAGLFRMASAPPFTMPTVASRPLGAIEATTVLGGLTLVFAAFAASQLVAVLRGGDYVRRTAGLSYAEYARSGFFQLLAVAVISLGVVLAARATTDLRSAGARRRFVLLGEVVVALTLLIVATAIRRLHLYDQAYGLTMLRLCSLLFAVWIGAVFVLLGISLTGIGGRRAWLTPAAAALALGGLVLTNAVNPEAIVVRHNVAQFAQSDKLDAWYLAYHLSDDAVPELARSLPKLQPEDAALVRDELCRGERHASGGFWGYNASRDAAVDARLAVCPALEI